MKRFVINVILFLVSFVIIIELVSRLFIDPYYFYSIDTYNFKPNNAKVSDTYNFKKTNHIDYLFIGSSRVPATINAELIMNRKKGKIAVVAGRGYTTEGIHYQALKNRISKFPDYVYGASVFLEYPGPDIFTDPFDEKAHTVWESYLPSQGKRAMPHLLLPHLDYTDFKYFLNKSKNSNWVKLEMILLYCFSSYRTIPYIKEMSNKYATRLEKRLFSNHVDDQLVNEGGIRNDNREEIEKRAVEEAIYRSKIIQEEPIFTFEYLDKSCLAYLNEIVTNNGGKFYLYKMPLCDVQENVYSSPKAVQNKKIFEQWLHSKGIEIIWNKNFTYRDVDFPDKWHLSKERRDEFTALLLDDLEVKEEGRRKN
ncbi:hypothetical protein [Olivibacter sitiensis]|uniref:hypothetical protein n=1 Tax=Olivibacter sitiensis TaxID=376470 RepID=UPI000421380F|nr:hypothetical protein [Olivibacter sitiensis]